MDPADFYSGIVVDAYAKLKSVSFAAERYAAFVRETGQPALEIGCGDGEPLLVLCAAGLDVDGVDSSLDMVQRCRDNAVDLGLDVNVFHQRVEQLSLDRRYASMYFAGPTFNLLPDDDTALQALRAINRHLSDGGRALIPLWIPEPTAAADLGVPREVEADGELLRFTALSENYDPDRRTRTTATRYEKATDAGVESADRDWTLHWHTPDGFRELCTAAGLTVVQLIDDASGTEVADTATAFTATVQA